jgi:hypothetical protein
MNIDLQDLTRLAEAVRARAERVLLTSYTFERVGECVPLGELHTQFLAERRNLDTSIDDLEAAAAALDALLIMMQDMDVWDTDEMLSQVRLWTEKGATNDLGDDDHDAGHVDGDDGEAFNVQAALAARPSALRILSLTSDGVSGAALVAGPLAEVQQAAQLFGAHVRFVAADAAGGAP